MQKWLPQNYSEALTRSKYPRLIHSMVRGTSVTFSKLKTPAYYTQWWQWESCRARNMEKHPKCDFLLTIFGTSGGSTKIPLLPGLVLVSWVWRVRPQLLPLHSLVHFESGMLVLRQTSKVHYLVISLFCLSASFNLISVQREVFQE